MNKESMLDVVRRHYNAHGSHKAMGSSSPSQVEPHFFLVRSFLGEIDIAILFNTKRCRYQCTFCSLPAKSSEEFIPADDIAAQYLGVLDRVKYAIGVLERLTIANEGSVLDVQTFPHSTLLEIVESSSALPGMTRVVIESRLEFVDVETLQDLRRLSGGKSIDVLTGFESADSRIREGILGKRESLDRFLVGLDRVAEAGCALTAYVLYKPDPRMTDEEAYLEAERSIDFLDEQTRRRDTSHSASGSTRCTFLEVRNGSGERCSWITSRPGSVMFLHSLTERMNRAYQFISG